MILDTGVEATIQGIGVFGGHDVAIAVGVNKVAQNLFAQTTVVHLVGGIEIVAASLSKRF